MEAASSTVVSRLVARAQRDPDVLAVILFGSQARGDAGARSDVDVCLVLSADRADERHRTEKRLDYLGGFDLDVSVFQALPLVVRSRILKEGQILFVRDEDALYDVAIRTARAWERFKPIHRMYLDQVARD
jgi:uncharacterized protein